MADPLVRHNLVFFAGSLVAGAFGYVYQFVAGRLLGPGEYAVVAAIFSVLYVTTVPTLVITVVTARYAAMYSASADLGRLRYLFRHLSLIVGGGSIVVTLAYLGIAKPVAGFLSVPLLPVLSIAPALPFLLLNPVNRGILQGDHRFASLSLVLLVDSVGRAVLCLVLIRLGAGAVGALIAVTAGTILSYAASLWPLRRLVRRGERRPLDLQRVAAYSMPAGVAIGGIALLTNVDVLLVKHFFGQSAGGQEQAGLYASVATLGRIVYFGTFSITSVMFARVAAQAAGGQSPLRTLNVSAAAMLALASAFVLMIAAFPRVAIGPFGPRFAGAIPYLPAFAAAMGVLALANLMTNYLLAIHDRRFIPVLLGGIGVEIAAITRFHESLWQVILSVSGSLLAVLACLLAIVYLGTRSLASVSAAAE